MRSARPLIRASLVAMSVVAGCVSIEQLAPPVDPSWSGGSADVAALQRGRYVYLTRCAECHVVEPVAGHSIARWQHILPEMYEEAELSSPQREDVKAYIFAAHRAVQLPPTTAVKR